MYEPHRCLAGCGRSITYTFALCAECERVYGTSPLTWPAWLRFLWSDTQKERRREKKIDNYETFFDDFDYEACSND